MPRYSLPPKPNENAQPFPFLKLSGKMRNAIYKLVVVSATPIEPLRWYNKYMINWVMGTYVHDDSYHIKNHIQSGITKVSRQLRQEALPIYYSENVFHMQSVRSLFDLERFMRVREHNLKYIRTMHFMATGCDLRVEIKPGKTTLKASYDDIHITFVEKAKERLVEALEKETESTAGEDIMGLHLTNLAKKRCEWDWNRTEEEVFRDLMGDKCPWPLDDSNSD